MSGFNNDIVSILRTCNLVGLDSVGMVVGNSEKYRSLYEALLKLKLLVTNEEVKPVMLYSYIIIPESATIDLLLKSLNSLSTQGVLIMELGELSHKFLDRYILNRHSLYATKIKFDNRSYLIIHSGEDYGN